MDSLSLSQARRVALAAQGFLDPMPATVTMRHLDRVVARTGVIQIDSVNVFARAHYMPLYSRLGPYDPALLHRASGVPVRASRSSTSGLRLVEYWAHVASYMPVELWPYMRHRMRFYEQNGHEWSSIRHNAELAASLLAELRDLGPRTARELDTGLPRSKTHWGWNWSESKKALEYLFAAGKVAVARRNGQFERVYDLAERVVPAPHFDAPEPAEADAKLELVRRAARAHGVASAKSIADYYRLKTVEANAALDVLVESGEVVPVEVEGWRRPAYLHAEARIPRKVRVRALLSPFDPLVWERERASQLFGFDYRIGIYTPAHQREHGYYALPFLLGDRPVARVDLKADRKAGVLLVQGVYYEADAPAETATELAEELQRAAGWLGLSTVVHRAG